MEFGGKYLFLAPRDRVWAALNDTAVLKAAIPGCSRLDWTGATTLECEIKVNLGVMSPTFTGDLELRNVDPAVRYTLAGKAEAAADISLTDAPGGTELLFVANGGADGGIMKFGKAVIGNSAQKIIDGFFERIGEAMSVTVTPLVR